MSNHGKREHHRRRRGQALRLQGHQEGPAQRELALAHERVHLQLPGQQGASVAYALSPILRKIYTNDEDYKQALNNHFRYYNTQPWLAAIILGACVAMEERDGLAAADAVQDLKIGTMGPLAGVGDSLLMTMIPTIMGSIAAYMAIEGNPVGAGIWFALILAIFWVRMHALEFGYKQGVKLVTDFSEKLPQPHCRRLRARPHRGRLPHRLGHRRHLPD